MESSKARVPSFQYQFVTSPPSLLSVFHHVLRCKYPFRRLCLLVKGLSEAPRGHGRGASRILWFFLSVAVASMSDEFVNDLYQRINPIVLVFSAFFSRFRVSRQL